MDFARKILQNYGWKDGDGLGKNKDGIAKPLKATLKFDNAGFGADQAAEDFNNHWWERLFNEAASNVSISQERGNIKMALKDENNSVEISTKSYSIRKLKKLRKSSGDVSANKSGYGNFLRASTLNNVGDEVDIHDKIDVNDIVISKVNALTDEELFKACGGRTAHKGARHGIKLSGKLARIEQQEAELLAKMLTNCDNFCDKPKKQKSKRIGSKAAIKQVKNTAVQIKEENEFKPKEKAHEMDKTFVAGHRLKKRKQKYCEAIRK